MARIVKLEYDPDVVGVPLMTPVDVFSDRPAGSEPDWTANVTPPEPVVVSVSDVMAKFRHNVPSDPALVIVGATPATEPLNDASL